MDHPHRLVAQDAARSHRPFSAHDMHVGAADGGQRDLDDGLAWPSRRNGHLLQADVAGAAKDKRPHRVGHRSPPNIVLPSNIVLPCNRLSHPTMGVARDSAAAHHSATGRTHPQPAPRWTTPPRGWTSDGSTEVLQWPGLPQALRAAIKP